MAAAFFNELAGLSLGRAESAGTHPADHVHPEVVAAMQELGIDLSQATPQLLTEELTSTAEMLVTMGCGEDCPFVPGLQREDWPLPDPKGSDLNAVRAIRDEVRRRVLDLIGRLG